MSLLPDIAQRRLQPELMDDPNLDPVEHARALLALTRLNLASRTASILWKHIHARASRATTKPLRILDIATGSGDIPVRIQRRAVRAGLSLAIDACDVSPRAVAIAREHSANKNVDVRLFVLDALKEPITRAYDIVMCSLFTHHLTALEAALLLSKMRDASQDVVLVSDLRRGLPGYALAFAAARAFSRSRVVRVDSLLSVRAAFTIGEFRTIADNAGLRNAAITPCWPCRFLLSWSKGGADVR